MLLAIETSCDETAVAVFDTDSFLKGERVTEKLFKADLISSQVKKHQPYGGVVPELAAREHVLNLPFVVDQALEKAGLKVSDISAVAVTKGPGLKGCLLVGLSYAKAFSYARKVPLLALNHLEGHIVSGELNEERINEYQYPVLALLVSGGHTQLVLMESFRKYQLIASTRDDAAGEAFDKSATLLSLPYPGGPELAKRAENGDPKSFDFPKGVRKDDSSFSFSGLKTSVYRTVTKLKNEAEDSMLSPQVVNDLSASVQSTIVETLVEKTISACKEHSPRTLVLTGGVAANKLLRKRLEEEAVKLKLNFVVPAFRWCTDNAGMIAWLGARIIQENPEKYSNWGKADITKGLGPEVEFDVGAIARWPLEEISK